MPRRGPRRRLAPNIFEDDTGCAVKVTVGGVTKERRFPRGTPLATLALARADLLGQQQAARPAHTGTLRADVVSYLQTVADARTRADQTRLLAHWVAAYGEQARQALTPLVIRQQLAAWRAAGAAASSCNHRLSALRAVWKAVADPDEPNYPAQVTKLPAPPPEPRAVSYALISRILEAMPESATKHRCALLAYAGLPPAQMMRIVPDTDILWDVPALRARPRRKGHGTQESWLPLVPQAVTALRALVALGALPGAFSTHSLYKSFQLAVRKLRATDPALPHIRPYDLRHSFASAALASSADLAGVQHLLQHSTPTMTTRYALAAVPARAARTALLLADALGAPLPEAKDRGTAQPSRRKSLKTKTRP